MKVLILLAVIVFGYMAINSAGNAPASAATPLAAPAPSGPKVAVNGFDCISHRTGTDMKGSLRNISSEPLKYVKIYADFGGQVFDGYINELTLQPGMTSTFLIPGPSGYAKECTLMYVQDRNGKRIN